MAQETRPIRHTISVYPRTCRWLAWHLLYLLVAGVVYLIVTGNLSL